MLYLNYPGMAGMTYEQASREAERLIKMSGWFDNFERLAALHSIMRERMNHDIRGRASVFNTYG